MFPVYLKSGYIFPDEREFVDNRSYAVVGLDDLCKFFAQHKNVDDEIFVQFRKHCDTTLQNRRCGIEKMLEGNMPSKHANNDAHWHTDYAQWAFIRELKAKLEEKSSDAWMKNRSKLPSVHRSPHLEQTCSAQKFAKWAAEGAMSSWADAEKRTLMNRGRGRGGAPYAEYWFTRFLFWRIEPHYPLRLHFGIWNEKVPSGDPWRAYRECFEQCFAGTALKPQRFQTRSNARRRIVGEVATTGVKTLLDNIATVHNEFVERIAKVKWGD